MKYTEKLQLKKPDLTDYVNISDINENMDTLDTAVKELQDGSTSIPDLDTDDKRLAGAINEIKNEVINTNNAIVNHQANPMPHTFVDNGITYRWGFRTVNGEPQMIYEEVTG
ncbi:hypothetical protein ACIQ4I_05490 [Rummeliibacillus sp. NPDC094406]|uniref:hypothetical protein n=1 Tax=Rummeliibacillus sp. NPDC094406 TaxID=3364511 RepID=UPI00380FC347